MARLTWLAVLILGIIGTSAGLVEANRQRRATEDALDESRVVTRFLGETLSSADPRNARGREVSVDSLLGDATRRVDQGALDEHPDAEAAVRMIIGRTYMGPGIGGRALPHFEWALRLRLRRYGDDDLRVAESKLELGLVKYDPDLLRQAYLVRRDALGEMHPKTLEARSAIGGCLNKSGHPEKAEPILREVLELRRKVVAESLAEESLLALAASLQSLGHFQFEQHHADEAEALLQQACKIYGDVLDSSHPDATFCQLQLGSVLVQAGKLEQAERKLRAVTETMKGLYGNDHHYVGHAKKALAQCLMEQQRFEEAAALMEEVLATMTAPVDIKRGVHAPYQPIGRLPDEA